MKKHLSRFTSREKCQKENAILNTDRLSSRGGKSPPESFTHNMTLAHVKQTKKISRLARLSALLFRCIFVVLVEGTVFSAVNIAHALPVSDRTPQVRDAIVDALALWDVNSAADVTEAHLANIVQLSMSNKNITTFKEGDFDGLTSLVRLSIGGNPFSSLPEGIFSGLTSLTWIDLGGNQISSLPTDVFSGLSSLTTLIMPANKLSILPAGLFSGLTSLEHISLWQNQLTTLPAGLFSGLSSLTEIDFKSNQISSLPADVFSGLSSLTTLRLDSNQISSLPADVFSGLSSLTTIGLEWNQLNNLSAGLFSGLSSLTTIGLGGNRLSNLPTGLFSGLSSLVSISLYRNQLSSLPMGIFSGLSSLTTLTLSDNAAELSLIMELQQVGVNQFKAVIATGAPFTIVVPLNVTNGSIMGGATTATIPIGHAESAPFTVIPTPGTSDAATVLIGTLPNLPSDHIGYTLAPFNLAPEFVEGPSTTRTVAEDIHTGGYIGTAVSATDPYNDLLTYTLSGADASSFSIDATTGQLRTSILLDYETRSTYTVTVNVTDGSLTSSITVTINVTDVEPEALNVGEPRTVRLFYLLPNDRPYRPEVVQEMKTGVLEVQNFYAEQMAAHGHGNKTFRIETDAQGVPIVHRVDGKHPDSVYSRGYTEGEIAEAFDNSENITLIVIDVSRETYSGVQGSGTGTKQNGWVIFYREWDWFIGSHELGHAFGLHHDFRDDAYILSYGKRNSSSASLSVCAADFLAVHPYFNSDVPLENESPPTVELISPTLYPQGAESVPIRLRVRDDDGLHQVILFVNTKKSLSVIGPEVKACRGLTGETDTIVEFNYDGKTPSDRVFSSSPTSFSDPLRHGIYVVAVDTDGNRTNTFTPMRFTLEEGVVQEITPLSERTPEVRDAIVAAVPGVNSANDVTEAHLAAITYLDIRKKNISALKAGDFSGLSSLGSLILGDNQLHSLPEGVFSGLTALWELHLYENQLTDLPVGVFSGLTTLRTINMGGNNLTSLREDVFAGLSSLTKLWIDVNKLSSLPENVFSGLSSLSNLSLSNNQLSSLPENVFSGLSSLAVLYLGNNQLNSLPSGVFSGLSSLSTLHLFNNQLRELPDGVFSGLPNLTSLFMGDNVVAPLPITVSLQEVADGQLKAVVPTGAPFDIVLPIRVSNGSINGGATNVTIPASSVESEVLSVTRTIGASGAVSVWIGALPSLPANHTGYRLAKATGEFNRLIIFDDISEVIMSGIITVGSWGNAFANGNATGFGYSRRDNAGSISNATFTYRGTTYTINGFGFAKVGNNSAHEYVLTISPGFPTCDKKLLSIGSLRLADASNGSAYGSHTYNWHGSWAIWAPIGQQWNFSITLHPTVPDAPTVTATNEGNQVLLSWETPCDGGIDITQHEYRQKIGNGSFGPWILIPNSATGEVNAISYTVLNVNNPLESTFEVRAENALGVSLPSAETIPVSAGFIPISERTPQVRDAIVAAVPGVNSAAEVTEAHLASIRGSLNLRDKGISALKAGDFDGLAYLSTLDLGVNQLTSLPDGVFDGLDRLTQLYLGGNQFSSLPARVFADLGSLTKLDLGNCYQLTSLSDEVFDGLDHLAELRLHNNRDLTSLPDGVFNSLTNLTILDLGDSGLTSLPDGVFNSLTNLTYLNLWRNRLTSLPDGVFASLGSLTRLDLANNRLTSLSDGVFADLSKLIVLLLAGNAVAPLPLIVSLEKVADGQFKAVAPAGAPFDLVLQISVTNGTITGGTTTLTIPKGSVESETLTVTRTAGTTAAVTLNIGTLPGLPPNHTGYELVKSADLPLEVVAEFIPFPVSQRTPAVRDAIVAAVPGVNSTSDVTLVHLAEITELSLNDKNITSLKTGDFHGLNLGNLYLENNQLTMLPEDIFDGLPSLVNLQLEGNQLTALPEGVFDELSSLKTLNLTGNQLVTLPEEIFNRLDLLWIDLRDNQLTELSLGVFGGQSSMTSINLQNNQLTALPNGVFDGLSSLTTISLQNNQLANLPNGIFEGLSSLTMLNLSGNAVDPMSLTVSLEKVRTDQIKAVAPTGASFDIVLPISVTNGSIAGGATSITIPTGSVESGTLTVTRTPDTTAAVTVDIGTLPGLPSDVPSSGYKLHQGYELVKSTDLPLNYPLPEVRNVIGNRTQQVQDAIIAAIPGVNSAADVTEEHLAAITSLDLSSKNIASLQAGDFDGLTALTNLNLSGNGHSIRVPSGIFDKLTELTHLNLNRTGALWGWSGFFDKLTNLTHLYMHQSDFASYNFAGIFDKNTELTHLYLSYNGLTSLPANIFAKNTKLIHLDLHFNDLSSLPDGIFDNLTALTWLDLSGNAVNPMPLTVSLERVAEGQFKAVAPTGAPFDIALPLSITNGSISGSATNITIPKGGVESVSLTVTRTPGTTTAVTVNIGTLPGLPPNHTGYTLVKSDALPLEVTSDGSGNRAPVFTASSTTRTIAENTATGVNIGTPVAATDADNDTLTYTLGGTNAASFSISSSTGQLQTKAALDYETKSTYTVSVTVSDGSLSDTITVTINVTDINEQQTQRTDVTTYEVGDEIPLPNGFNTPRLTMGTGRSLTADNGTYTCASEDNCIIQDGQVTQGTIEIATVVANTAPVFTEGASTTRTIAENTATGVNIGTPVAATDAQNDTLTYTLSGTDAASFSINSSTGQLQTKAELDYETKRTYIVTITVSDGSLTDTITVTINVTNIAETSTATTAVNIPDSNLRAKIETALGKGSGDPISAAEMETLTTLNAQDASISNLTGLETATNLTTLKLGDNTISDISALVGLTELTELQLWDNQISNISALAGLTNLTRLYLWGNTISDIAAASRLTNLTRLYLGENAISNISAVAGLTNLTHLYLNENSISDISPIAGLTNLTELRIGNNAIINISAVAKLTNLVWLDAPNNSISDISAVANLTNLTSLMLTGNTISDISTLIRLTKLIELYLEENSILDLSPLAANTGLGANTEIDVQGNPLSYPSIYTHIPALQARGVYIDFDNRTPTAPTKISGDTQQGAPSTTLAQPFVVEVRDGDSAAFAGVPVTFAVTAGGGTLSVTSTATNTNGRAESTLILGSSAGTNTVRVSVQGVSQAATFTAEAATTNTAPTFTEGTNTTRSVAENTAAGQNIGAAITATDAENDTLIYILSGTNAASFTIESTTGQLKTRAALDYETKSTYTVTITVSDGSLTDTITVPINITDIVETPVISTLNLLRGRTPQVRDAIVAAVPGVNSANNVTAAHLAAITNLHLNDKSITSLKTNDFSGLSSLTSLNLNDNQLTTLPKGVFSGLSSLTSLNLNDNQLTTLPEGVFGRLSSLGTIGLNGNQLTTLPQVLFSGLSSLQVIGLSSNRLTTLPQVLFSGLSSLQVIVLNGNQLITLPDGIFDGLSGLQLLHLHGNTVNPLPFTISYSKVGEGQFKAVASIGTPFAIVLPVTVTNGSINGGTTTITIPAGSVESNALTVTRTPGTTFAVTVNIGTLPGLPPNHQGYQLAKSTNLPLEIISPLANSAPVFTESSSTTRSVAENAATGVNIGSAIAATDADNDALTYTLSGTDAASFSIVRTSGQLRTRAALDYETKRSYTVTVTVSDGSFTDTITVTINVNDVADTAVVSTLTPVCDRTPQVRDTIVAAVPGVSDCKDVTEAHLAAISSLDLGHKSISALKASDFDGLSGLHGIDLTDNQLSTLPVDVFSGLSSLVGLALDNNQLTSLPENLFSGLSSLRNLYLNQNQLTALPENLFSGLSSLEQINLHTNRLTTLPANVFSGLSSLTQIYLRNNRLTSLSPELFSGLSSLQYLYLNNNRLRTLPAGILSGLSSLTQLLLNDNQMSTLSREIFRGFTASSWLWLQGNTVDPLPLTVSLEKVGVNRFKATAPAGAPFTITIPINVANGTISSGVSTLTIPQGSVESGRLTVTRTAGTTAAVTVAIGTLPGLPNNHQGYRLVKSTDPPLEIISGPGNRAPVFTEGASTTRTVTENTASGTNIGRAITATDADNDTLTYILTGTDAASFSIVRTSGQLQTKSALDYETKTTYTVTITVSDGSLTDTITVTINVTDIDETPTDTGICKVGDILAPGESCTYPGTDATFSVLDNGHARWNIPGLPSWLAWANQVSIGGSLSFTATINDDSYHFVAEEGSNDSWEIKEIGDDRTQQPEEPEQPGDVGGTPTLSVTTVSPLTEATLHESVVTLTLSGGTYESTVFDIRRSLTVSGITGADFETFSVVRVNDTQATVELEFDGNISTSGTLTFNLRSDAIANYDGAALTAQISIPAVTESVVASTVSPLTEVTLDESVVTLTLSGRKFEQRTSRIRGAVSVSGISGVTARSFDIDRVSDTQVTVELTFNGNLNTDGMLTFTVGPGAIAGYDGTALTAQLSVAATTETPTVTDPQPPQQPDTTDARVTFESTTPSGYTRVTLSNTGPVWGVPTQFTTDSDTGTVAYMLLAKLKGCSFADTEVSRQSKVYIKTQALGSLSNFASETVCRKTSRTWTSSWTGVRITHLRFFDESSTPNIKEAIYNDATGQIEIPGESVQTPTPTPTNNAPTFTAGSRTTRTIAENTAAGRNIGSPVSATDADNDTLTYTLGGTNASAFSIERNTGQLKTKSALDYETKRTYTVTITVSDGSLSDTITVTINVTDIAESSTSVAVCQVGDVLAPGESCTYPGTDTEFSVLSDGRGKFGFFTSGNSLNINNTVINGQSYTLVAQKLTSGSWEIEQIGDSSAQQPDPPQQPEQPQQPGGGVGTPTLSVTSTSPLTEATLHGGIITLTLSGGTYESTAFDIRRSLTVSGITGADFETFSVVRVSDTQATVELEFDGNISTSDTLTFTLESDAITNYEGTALTAQIAVPAVTESITASTDAPLTEATLDESVVTLTLSGRKFEQRNSRIRGAVSVSGISGVTTRSFDIDRVSDTQVTVELTFDGNISTDSTLTFTVHAGAIAGYNGPALTARVSVSATTEAPEDTGVQTPDPPQQPQQSGSGGGTPTLSASTTTSLTEATLHEGVVTLTLSGGTYERSKFTIGNALTVSGIEGVTIPWHQPERKSETQITVELEFNGNINTNSTLTFSVGAGAIVNYTGSALTVQVSVSANTESVVASTVSPLTETTLNESIVTLTLNGAKYAESIFEIRDAVTVSGIAGVTKPWNQPERKSDTEVTVELEFDGTDFDTSFTLTFTVEADAIAGYNGPALTTQISVSAVTESVVASTTTPLTEATLNESIVTLTLSGRNYARSIWNIRGAVTVSGINGVTMPWNQPDRASDTKITIELEFDGNMDTDATLTFTVEADAIEGYNGPALTAQISVTATEQVLRAPSGISLMHVPLQVTAVDGVAQTIESVGDLYNALGGMNTVNLLITHNPKTQEWHSYLGEASRGTSADTVLTDNQGIIADMKAPVSLHLDGDALGSNGSSSITLHPGPNLVGIPLRDSRITHVSDLLALEGIGGNVSAITVSNNGSFQTVEQAGNAGDIPITGGQSFILNARETATVAISGQGWDNVSGMVAAAPVALTGIQVGNITPVLALRGSIVSPAGERSRLPHLRSGSGFRVIVKNLSTRKSVATVTGDAGGHYQLTVVDTETGKAAQIGDTLEISVRSTDPRIGVQPLRHTVTAEDVKRSRVELGNLIVYEIPTETALLPNYPNPFNPETWIPYRLAKDAFVILTIYDQTGQVVRTLDVGHQIAAVYESRSKAIHWDGRNEFGEGVASGVYFYHLSAGDYYSTRKMLIIK